ncbi:MAG: DUF1534 domain-containing protein [Methyloprofundus sp.]|nr:DUF1534 domain-containing protein [Methyloprofundus sp.]
MLTLQRGNAAGDAPRHAIQCNSHKQKASILASQTIFSFVSPQFLLYVQLALLYPILH